MTDYWRKKGRSGYTIWRFRLEKINKEEIDSKIDTVPIFEEPYSNYSPTTRRKYIVNRIIRATNNIQFIKNLYDDTCQICGIQIKSLVSKYSEAAHIKALGYPHNGPDTKENILYLCPNHHKMLDLGIISIDDNFKVLGMINTVLTVHPKHNIDKEFLQYHKNHHYKVL